MRCCLIISKLNFKTIWTLKTITKDFLIVAKIHSFVAVILNQYYTFLNSLLSA